MSYTHIKPGEEIEISSRIYHSEADTPIAELIDLPMEELDRMEQASVKKEQELFKAMCDLEPLWGKQAKESRRIREAKAYLRTIPVEHTGNQWTEDRYGRHEISNMVYQMTWRVYERTKWSVIEQKSIVTGWDLSWYLWFNTVADPDKSGSGRQIAGQDRKVFKDKAAMDKYLQGRIAAYAHLFTEISPPIPKGEEGRFSVNGVLLPGYTVETTVDDLLALLDENDGKEIPTQAPKPITQKALGHKHKRSTPTR